VLISWDAPARRPDAGQIEHGEFANRSEGHEPGSVPLPIDGPFPLKDLGETDSDRCRGVQNASVLLVLRLRLMVEAVSFNRAVEAKLVPERGMAPRTKVNSPQLRVFRDDVDRRLDVFEVRERRRRPEGRS